VVFFHMVLETLRLPTVISRIPTACLRRALFLGLTAFFFIRLFYRLTWKPSRPSSLPEDLRQLPEVINFRVLSGVPRQIRSGSELRRNSLTRVIAWPGEPSVYGTEKDYCFSISMKAFLPRVPQRGHRPGILNFACGPKLHPEAVCSLIQDHPRGS
jgi:hypothetical protein